MLKKSLLLLSCFTLLTSPFTLSAAAATVQVPRTADLGCYSQLNVQIPCAGTGQDADIMAGATWPTPRVTDNNNGTVTDNLTGLIWLKNAKCTDTVGGIAGVGVTWPNALRWSNALADGACGLTDGSLSGEWRLPNVNEIDNLLNHTSGPTNFIYHSFSNVVSFTSGAYWTSTTYAPYPSCAWIVDSGSALNYRLKTITGMTNIWPVRDGKTAATVTIPATGQTGCWDGNGAAIDCTGTGQDGDKKKGAAWPIPRFSDNGDQTVTDNLTGLMWTKDAELAGGNNGWQQSFDYVAAMNSANSGAGSMGYNDWRLPNRLELRSLLNRQESNVATWLNTPTGPFSIQSSDYGSWFAQSSNIYNSSWLVNFRDGRSPYLAKLNTLGQHVWPVRGGQVGNSVIAVSPALKNFGSVATNTGSDVQVFIISNSGLRDLAVSSIAVTGGDSSMFIVTPGDSTGGTCGATPSLAPAASCTVTVSFTPTSVGAKVTTMRIVSDGLASSKDVALSGTGVQPTFTVGVSVIGGNGNISCESPVNQGESSICTIQPASNYHLTSLTDNGMDKMASVSANRYTITNVTTNHAIAGQFALNLSANAGADQTVTCAGPSGVQVTLDGSASAGVADYSWNGPFGTATGVNPTVVMPWGSHAVTLTVADAAGHTATDTVVINVTDTAQPLVNAIYDGTRGENSWFVSNVSFNLAATDSCSGIKEIHYLLDNVESVVTGTAAAFIITGDGSHTVTYWAVDNAGNVGVPPAVPSLVKISTVAPAVSAAVVGGAPVNTATDVYYTSCLNVTFQTQAGVAGGITEYSLDNGTTWLHYTGAFPLCASTNVTYRSTNEAGLKTFGAITVNIDMTPPVISALVSPEANLDGWHKGAVTVNYTCSDSGSGITSCSAPITVNGNLAGEVITGEAVDMAGNRATASVTVKIDKTAPVITITGVTNGATYNLGLVPEAAFSAYDALSGIAMNNVITTGTPDASGCGTFTYTATATDKAGNTASAAVTYVIKATTQGTITLITSLVDMGVIPSHTSVTLLDTLARASTDYASSLVLGFNMMNVFQNQVNSAFNSNKIDETTKTLLLNAANNIIANQGQ